MSRMLRLFLLFWSCSIFFCSFAQDTKATVNEKHEPVEVLQPIPSHWSKYHIKEPIFNGLVHVVETGKKHKNTIVLVHGLGYSGLRDWLDIIPALESSYHVVALDLPGFGESDPTSIQLAPSKYATLLKWLIPHFSQQKVTLIGHSMGGAISLRFAAEFPDMLERLIMVDTAGVLQRSVFVRHMTQMPARYEWLAKYQHNFKFIDTAVNKVNRFLNRISGAVLTQLDRLPDPTIVLMQNEFAQKYVYKDRPTLNAAIGLINEDFSSAINNLHVPTHIIWGEFDRVAPLRTGELLEAQLQNAELHVIKEAGHVPMKEQTENFMHMLNVALHRQPVSPIDLSKFTAVTEQLNDLICNAQNDQVYTGHFNNIFITGCKYITLENVTAKNVVIEKSEVTLSHVDVASSNLAMDVSQSFVTMTNVTLKGQTALQATGSTIDAAGTKFDVSHQAINVVADSLLYLSVSQKNQAGNLQFLHGMSQGNHFDLR